MQTPIKIFFWMNCVFLMVWRISDEERLKKVKVISDLERATLLEEMSQR
jgi:hypothetical protein